MKKLVVLTFSFIMIFTLCFSTVYAKEFPDVDQSHWAYQYITELTDNGVINGYVDGTYKPEGTVKISEYLKLVMAAVWPVYIDLDEVPAKIDHWISPYLYMAEVDGVIDEGDITLENVENPITRIDMAKIIANADIMELGNDAQYGALLPFVDVAGLDSEERALLSHAYSRGLIKGYDDGTFKPDKTMTRAEAATMIWRFMQSKGGI